ncbi:TetR/AcrR family transcriptional regulator [Rhodococcus sp. SGAir0479]|uniref:TetR/AcrR family transcriptional regulator n=1 Tax=Rhodococcus sp. SGAir0479 TaxID=2567884 RepID=UPI00158686D4|nr:TetR/AcrR family transcriptional regulator [Rhodococcus sp. SGAir0479]
MSPQPRRYQGRTAIERTAERRERLFEAALALFGRPGGEGTTMTAICAEAQLTERYFYESFSSRDDLLTQLVQRIADEIRRAVLAALEAPAGTPNDRARAAIAAFVQVLTSDPRKGRATIIESAGAEPLRTHRRTLLREFAQLTVEGSHELYGDRALPSPHDQLTALMFVGGLAELITAWLGGEIDATPEHIVDAATAQFTSTAHR